MLQNLDALSMHAPLSSFSCHFWTDVWHLFLARIVQL